MRYGFLRTYRPVLDDARFVHSTSWRNIAVDAMKLPEWLGYRTEAS
jgi:hypothetical protein